VNDTRTQHVRTSREVAPPSSLSVVIPAYNAAGTLAHQLEALAAQRCDQDWEVLLVDNGSTAGTADLARRYARRFQAFRIIAAGPERGHSSPRNARARAARGELFVYCDADDVVPGLASGDG
jgi:glycosyltransferase involved in cell wall biosynthesis